MKQEQTTPKVQVMNVNVMNKLNAHIFLLLLFFFYNRWRSYLIAKQHIEEVYVFFCL